jgi:AraC-like DNA-binding protein
MPLLTHIPRPPLGRFLELFWHCDGAAAPAGVERILPTGGTQVIFNLRDTPFQFGVTNDPTRLTRHRGPLLCGPRSTFSLVAGAGQAATVGIVFKPGGTGSFFAPPAGELHNQHLPLADLWGAAANELHDRLLNARSARARFGILEDALLRQLRRQTDHLPAVQYALQAFAVVPQNHSIAEVAEELGLSPRWFIQIFRDHVGLTPKVHCRLRRFQAVIQRISGPEPPDWAELALQSGYFDQAHFIRDFRSFSGLTPTAYRNCRAGHPNHVRQI